MEASVSEIKLFPLETMDIHEPNLWEFFGYMIDRQDAWYNRTILGKPRPWTKNKWIQKHKFCNVYRELDRSSQWLINEVFIKSREKGLMIEDLILAIFIFRIYNRPEVFQVIDIPTYDDFDLDDFIGCLDDLKSQGVPVLNPAAYRIYSYMGKNDLYREYARVFIPQLRERIPRIIKARKSPEQVIGIMREIHGIGVFISHEFYMDMTYLNRYVESGIFPFTEDDWTAVLPGSQRGIRYLFPSLKGERQKDAIYVLRDISGGFFSDLGGFKYLQWDKKNGYSVSSKGSVTLHTIEFNLCEYQKFKKIINGVGRQPIFNPKTF